MHPDRVVAIMSGTSYLTTASCIVFVGNIPYGLSETQITDIFSSVGRVVCFRMVFDRETGRSKGYGFAEYIDAETAASAVRNLDNYEIMGRKLRVDYSSQGYVGKEGYPGREGYVAKESAYATKDSYSTMVAKDANYNGERIVYNAEVGYNTTTTTTTTTSGGDLGRYGVPGAAVMGGGESSLSTRYGAPNLPAQLPPTIADISTSTPAITPLVPILPPGVEVHPNLTTPDAISKILATIPLPQLLCMLLQMKELATTDPAKTIELLRQCPQLSYAIFQSMIMMNLIEPGVLSQLLDTNSSASKYNQSHPAVIGTHSPNMSHKAASIPHQPTTLQITPHIPTTPQQASFYNYQTQHSSLPTRNPHSEFASSIAHQQAQQQQLMQGMQGPDKAMLLQRVMVLTQEEISRLPAEQQQQVLLLKHRLMTEGLAGHGQAAYQ